MLPSIVRARTPALQPAWSPALRTRLRCAIAAARGRGGRVAIEPIELDGARLGTTRRLRRGKHRGEKVTLGHRGDAGTEQRGILQKFAAGGGVQGESPRRAAMLGEARHRRPLYRVSRREGRG